MDPTNPFEILLPPALLTEVEALAAFERRPPLSIVREAVENFLSDRRRFMDLGETSAPRSKRLPDDAATRMIERRPRHPLPHGMSIRDLMIDGRA